MKKTFGFLFVAALILSSCSKEVQTNEDVTHDNEMSTSTFGDQIGEIVDGVPTITADKKVLLAKWNATLGAKDLVVGLNTLELVKVDGDLYMMAIGDAYTSTKAVLINGRGLHFTTTEMICTSAEMEDSPCCLPRCEICTPCAGADTCTQTASS